MFQRWLRQIIMEWRQPRPRNPLWFVALPVALCLTDMAATLRGQPDAYWQGNYNDPVEMNLVAWVALRLHPGVFLAGGLAWVVAFAVFIRCAPRRQALLAGLALIVGHAIGTSSWFPRIFPFWFLVGVAFWLVTLVLALPTGLAWLRMQKGAFDSSRGDSIPPVLF
jgi:hypothetical protein